MIYFIFSAILVSLIALYFWTQRNLPPGPWGLPIVGYLLWLDPKKPYITLTNLSYKYGPIYGLNLGSVYTVVLADAKLIRQAFAKNEFTGRAPLYVTHGIMKGYGLICAEGDLWRDQRKFVACSLKNFGMTKFGPKRGKLEGWILEGVNEFIAIVTREVELKQKAIDPQHFLQHCLGNVMNYMVFGLKWAIDDPTWKWLQELQEEGTKLIGIAGPLNFLPFLRYIPSMRKPLEYVVEGQRKTHELYKKLISDYQKRKDSGNLNEIHTDHFINAFLEERQLRKDDPSQTFLSDEQFLHLLADLFGAGLDTTLTTLRWFLLFVAKHQNVQQKLHEELDSILEKNAMPKLNDMDLLPMMEATLAETQRIRSVVPVGIPHGTTETTTFNGYTIPRGTMVIPLQWAVHMDPKQWQNPERFIPERFLNDNGKFEKPEHFIPFQIGKRICVGEELGKMLLFLFGATIVHKFHISLDPNEKYDFDGICGITLTLHSYKIIFKCRN